MNHDTAADLEAQKSLLWVQAPREPLAVSRVPAVTWRHFRRYMFFSLSSSANEIGISADRKRVINESLSSRPK